LELDEERDYKEGLSNRENADKGGLAKVLEGDALREDSGVGREDLHARTRGYTTQRR
jgi:hypothetical protein